MVIENGIKYEDTYGHNLQATGFVYGFQTNEVVIPQKVDGKKVVQITPSAFANNSCIEKVVIPESIEFIGDNAFENCSNLKTVALTPVIDFDQRLTLTISYKAFANCAKLERFNSQNRIVTLKEECFRDCVQLQLLNVYIQRVEDLCFVDCKSLKKIKFSQSARLNKNCLAGVYPNELCFRGDGIIPECVLLFIQKYNIKIQCVYESNLEKLAYNGYHVCFVEKHKI